MGLSLAQTIPVLPKPVYFFRGRRSESNLLPDQRESWLCSAQVWQYVIHQYAEGRPLWDDRYHRQLPSQRIQPRWVAPEEDSDPEAVHDHGLEWHRHPDFMYEWPQQDEPWIQQLLHRKRKVSLFLQQTPRHSMCIRHGLCRARSSGRPPLCPRNKLKRV